jgi:hypothetical protein
MITAFLILAEPEQLQYPYVESVVSLVGLCDRIIVNFADGTSPGFRRREETSLRLLQKIAADNSDKCKIDIVLDSAWPEQHLIQYDDLVRIFQGGLDMCSTGWFLRFDADNVFSEKSIAAVRHALMTDLSDTHVVFFPRVDVVNRHQIHVNEGSRDLYALNLDKLKSDKIEYCISPRKSEWCRTSFSSKPRDYVIRDVSLMPLNYDATFFTRQRLIDFWRKTAILYKNAGHSEDRVSEMTDDQVLSDYKDYISRKRAARRQIDHHPHVMQRRIGSMTQEMWGYDNFGGLR